MKKIILLLTLILITFSYSAQTKINTYAANYGKWSDYTKLWTWEGWKAESITFTIQGSIILVNDVAKSTYITYGEGVEEDSYVSWTATDEKGRECIFSMSLNGAEENYILIMYDSMCFKYAY